MASILARLAAWWTPESGGEVLRSALAVAKPTQETLKLGSDFAPYPIMPTYSPTVAMSALGADPWTFAQLSRAGMDLARLPLRVSKTGQRKDQLLPSHPLVELLRRPAPGCSGFLLRSQWTVDRRATGDAFGLKVYSAGKWSGIMRLPPQSVSAIPSQNGAAKAYEYNHAGTTYTFQPAFIIHIRGISWQDGPEGMLSGTGFIEPLNRTIGTSIELSKRLEKSARQGRPGALAWPAHVPGQLSPNPDTVKEARKRFKQTLAEASGGAAFLGIPIEWKPIDWSPEELQTTEAMERLVQERIAVGGVPPVRLGRETTNYATARQQSEVYWGDELQAEAELIDAELTYHARLEFGDDSLNVWHDFGSVPALQETKTAALQRVSLHILNGMNPADAYAYEGMEEAPISADLIDVPVAEDDAPALSAETAAHVRRSLPDLWASSDRVGAIVHERVAAALDSGRGDGATRLLERRLTLAARLRHSDDLAGVVACAHWLIVPIRGEAWMRKVVAEAVATQAGEQEAGDWWASDGS